MVRVKRGSVARKRRRKLLKRAKGFRGSLSKLFRPAHQAVIRAMCYATVHRKLRKRDMRSLWITRINAAARELGISYGNLMGGLKKAKIDVDRKILADLAVNDSEAFKKIIDIVKGLPTGRQAANK